MVWYNMRVHAAQQFKSDIDHILNKQDLTHVSLSQASYGVFFIRYHEHHVLQIKATQLCCSLENTNHSTILSHTWPYHTQF